MKPILIICGPTGTGKTKLALKLAKKFNGELINADSRQVYRGLDAITGKDRSEEIPIWLYDVVDTDQEFSVAQFVRLARSAINDIQKRGKLPIVVGGTGFYLRALTQSIDTISIPPNRILRKQLAVLPIEELQKRVSIHRLEKMNNSDRKNPRRLIRAIEVAGTTSPQTVTKYDALWIGLTMPLPALKKRITERIESRWNKALGEVGEDLPPILGAGPLLAFKHGEISKDEAILKWAVAEYQYAKRQLTWFRKQNGIAWYTISHDK
ncbi:tRNA (adenosine(37)-N6)-dimethylallyltransferase MiaA [Candidatus Gottesmanbacteria bacterium RIFCSPHIGHO2_01_FULL_46_14]|uniref:tRNA dimethylallyltransferase n=1 Tax=Candidatus Gottesmanbacteria bacterium RIFCSPHIGHO2_01_FULL_46_14 TaxID=1798380 RepID=A0A1F5ZPH8_9BACT|nr:MAG: tRNA (adenosine(37)-N6)-dimethylallyltransferase MiaA [Candidatus Gottesmanbacteria bacterium RIFCSPHIGHO2_01_FULL_46_14]